MISSVNNVKRMIDVLNNKVNVLKNKVNVFTHCYIEKRVRTCTCILVYTSVANKYNLCIHKQFHDHDQQYNIAIGIYRAQNKLIKAFMYRQNKVINEIS